MVEQYYGRIRCYHETSNCGEYGGISWLSLTDLSLQLGYNSGFISLKMRSGRYSSIGNLLDSIHTVKTYKGVYWTSYKDVGQYFGANADVVYSYLIKDSVRTIQDYIDYELDKRGLLSLN